MTRRHDPEESFNRAALETIAEQIPQADGHRLCEWPHCTRAADYRAPRSPRQFRPFRWFCLDHVRSYNQAWNYFAGMDSDAIEAEIQRDTVWHRPSWPLGARPCDGSRVRTDRFQDPLGAFGGNGGAAADRRERQRTPRDDALNTLGLAAEADLVDIKARYKVLVKETHPDTNGGCKDSEERFKAINAAYSYLVKSDPS